MNQYKTKKKGRENLYFYDSAKRNITFFFFVFLSNLYFNIIEIFISYNFLVIYRYKKIVFFNDYHLI